jgi:CCR4-NOT transcriptional complex subunit CAF120
VLSISTAGKNRYLLHFNSVHSLTQWTAGIRLAMFENSSLQELYTGSLIAGKGKHLNNIKTIMERSKFRNEDWARVRFGAGTPWRRCWCVIEPPDEKEWQKVNKTMKKRSAYEKTPLPKGNIKFYDTKKIKKVTPIATITDAYAAYAIYPQAKPLIDQSTLVKVEGRITIHSTPESTTEGFVFVMPELHPAVSGFEMMLRWLFPVWDTFHLYGRPNRLIADKLDAKGLMFAMPQHKRYGYLDIMDMASLIHTDGSQKWNEREWKKQMKDLTSKRMATMRENRMSSALGPRAGFASMGSRVGAHFSDESATTLASTPASRGHAHSMSTTDVGALSPPKRAPTAPNTLPAHNYHMRSASESIGLSPQKSRDNSYQKSRLSMDQSPVDSPQMMPQMMPSPAPPVHQQLYANGRPGHGENGLADSRESSDSSLNLQRSQSHAAAEVNEAMHQPTPPGPVAAPPTFQHQGTEQPRRRPQDRPEMRREKSRMSNATLEQMAEVNKLRSAGTAGAAAAAAWRGGQNENAPRGVNTNPDVLRTSANLSQAMVADGSHMTESPADVRPPEIRQPSQHSIRRKPLPESSSSTSIPRVQPGDPLLMARTQSSDRASGRSASHHERDSSPDYASTRPSEDNKSLKSIPRARTGVLKTVGDPGLTDEGFGTTRSSDIPDIDFGVTQSLTPGTSRPGTALGFSGSGSRPDTGLGASPGGSRPITPMGMGRATLEGVSPMRTPEALAEDKRASYFGRPSPHSRSPSYAWQPGMAGGRQSPGPTLSPEEFVQQRAMAAQYPSGYIPHRSASTNKLEANAAAVQGPKKLQKKRDSRPSSRNSAHLLDYSTNLSAREQEHVARMTGGPLLNMGERSRTPDPGVGLIGAIEAREQERKNVKEGVSGHMVQAAIAQRQHHVQAQQFQAQKDAQRMSMYSQQYGYGQPPQTQYTTWGQPIPTQQTFQQPPQQQQWYPQGHPNAGQSQQYGQHGQQQQQQYGPARGQHQQNYGGYYQ